MSVSNVMREDLMEQYISTENVARFLGVTRPTVIKYIQEERLNAMRAGRAYKISREDLVAFARGTGMSEKRLSGLDNFLRRQSRKTRSLDSIGAPQPLVLNDPTEPLPKDPECFYYIAARPAGAGGELVVRVNTHKFFIGRHSLASLSLRDPYVSSLHATLIYQDETVTVLDQSTNGTYLASGMLHSGGSRVIGNGDQVRVGGTVLTLISTRDIDQYLGSDD